jgi:hypothetical protein
MRPEQPISRILSPLRVAPQRVAIIHLRAAVARRLLRPTRELGRAILKRPPIWSCTGWGLPSFPGHPGNWCALTAPFHPYSRSGLPEGTRQWERYTFCCTFLRVAATPCYGAPCPAVFGLSSRPESGPSDRLDCSDRTISEIFFRRLSSRSNQRDGIAHNDV